MVYPELFHLYRRFTTNNSILLGYHACNIGVIMIVNGELVAVCKLSNGRRVEIYGYVKISLSTIYMIVDVSLNFEGNVGPTLHPAHLLSNFVVLSVTW